MCPYLVLHQLGHVEEWKFNLSTIRIILFGNPQLITVGVCARLMINKQNVGRSYVPKHLQRF